MGTYTVKTYRNKIASMKRNLSSIQRKIPKEAARFMIFNAKSMVPSQTGRLMSSTGWRSRKKGEATAYSGYTNKGFPVAQFVNLSPGYSALNFSNASWQPFFKVPQVISYGSPAITPAGNNVRWTGTPRYWDIARKRTANFFRKKAIEGLKMTLR